MKIVEPRVDVLHTGMEKSFMSPEQFIEMVGRTCYKSEHKITPESAPKFVRNLINRGHEPMLEHWSLIFRAASENVYEQILCDWQTFNPQGFESTRPVADGVLTESLSDEILEKMYYEKWDGKLPGVYGGDGNLLQIPVGKD